MTRTRSFVLIVLALLATGATVVPVMAQGIVVHKSSAPHR